VFVGATGALPPSTQLYMRLSEINAPGPAARYVVVSGRRGGALAIRSWTKRGTMDNAHRLRTILGRRLTMLLAVGALVAMATLTILVGGWASDTPSSTRMIATHGDDTQVTPTGSAGQPSTVGTVKAPPFYGGGWPGGGPFHGGGWPGH
jgi:hypothetical protein